MSDQFNAIELLKSKETPPPNEVEDLMVLMCSMYASNDELLIYRTPPGKNLEDSLNVSNWQSSSSNSRVSSNNLQKKEDNVEQEEQAFQYC